jgi:hypothetical protein
MKETDVWVPPKISKYLGSIKINQYPNPIKINKYMGPAKN